MDTVSNHLIEVGLLAVMAIISGFITSVYRRLNKQADVMITIHTSLSAVRGDCKSLHEHVLRHNVWLKDHETKVDALTIGVAKSEEKSKEVFRRLEKIDEGLDGIVVLIRDMDRK